MFSPKTPVTKARPSSYMMRSNTRTPRSARAKSGIVNQSFHTSHIFLEEASQHKIEAFGAPLPVLITEALTLSDRSTTEVTASIDPSGWAWLVGGRKLFVWRYKGSETQKSSRNIQCKELILPASDLAHSAERVCVIPSEHPGQPAACVAVSPEGVVRYWPNIAFESSTAEISAELKGEECARVIHFQPHGCLLATTTSSLLLLQPTTGQANISCKPLKSSQGIFSGISRRMSSFIFGASQMQTNGAPLQSIIASHEDEYDDEDDEENEDMRSFYVLSGNHLNKWQVPSVGPEKLLYQVDADRLFREALAKKVWDQDSVQLPQLNTWLLDLQLTREGVVMLGAGVNLEASNSVYYALAYLESFEDAQPASVSDLTLLDYTQPYTEESEEHLTCYKLLSPSDKSSQVYIYSPSSILMLHDKNSLDKMDLKTSGDKILGAGSCDGTAVFLSNTHGIFSVAPRLTEASVMDISNNQASMTRAELSSVMGSLTKMAKASAADDVATKLKDVFIASIDGDQEQVASLVEELCLVTRPQPGVEGSELDHTVATVSRDLIDDYPSADPRWAEANREGSGGGASVIILQQLRDKQKAHDLFVQFLKTYGIWNQLGIVNIRESVMPTRLLLCEHVEKLEATIAVRELHTQNQKLVDTCIRRALKARNVKVPAALTAPDVFYREVSSVPEITQLLLDYEQEELSSDRGSSAVLHLVMAVNSILEAMLHRALQYRQSHAEMYADDREEIPEYIPWTATASMRDAIRKQIALSFSDGVREARELEVQGVLYQNIVGLSDFLMDGYASQLSSLRTQTDAQDRCDQLEQTFQKERHQLILPLLEHKQYERAASLAEKFEDFEMLMKICDVTDNQERLQRYRRQFADRGFCQFVFNWYMREGKRGRLLTERMGEGEELSDFLNADNVRYLSWLHEVGRGNFLAAHNALSSLAGSERNFLSKKKTLLSLSKLAGLAAENAEESIQDTIEAINEELDLVLHQEQLPSKTVENVGMDPENMRVLSPEELIKLYVSEKNEFANELDVKKALDLLRYVDKSHGMKESEELKLHIWCRAILMDSWSDANQAEPLDSKREKIFFKTVDLVYMEGELENLLPDLDSLLSCAELQELSQQANFRFLMRGGYEQIQNALSAAN
ncbi:nuclear pore complex protein Nup133 [Aplysia californica]|uniref:Nuclear pore complex protein Nup133 n=1 Tax=Aplysia californica TaxID=6500 RepID=A0ABM1A3C1_APLCA|nr:nuclear pore complex protein Nup133 [Aplysia californica]